MRVDRIDEYRWRVPRHRGMRAEGLVFADQGLINDLEGTLGSGNHVVEVGYVAERFDDPVSDRLGLHPGTVTILIHSGSRGLGYQVCRDYLQTMLNAADKHDIRLRDKQLSCAPVKSPEGRRYWGAMDAAANYAFANRQLMAHYARSAVATVFGPAAAERTHLVYDVCHNAAKHEQHEVQGKSCRLCVHRKGKTRAFPPGHPDLASQFRDIGQPVVIPGDMGRYSYVLVGTEGAYRETFGSSCHGAGRRLSRHAAKNLARSRDIPQELAASGVVLRAANRATVEEEIPEAYKDVARVVGVVHAAGIGRKVAQLRPIGVVKG
jgi:tRNA-splicing ligase RtcB (3'-phosphate/5'-hydroxy nucleic acid ligase)